MQYSAVVHCCNARGHPTALHCIVCCLHCITACVCLDTLRRLPTCATQGKNVASETCAFVRVHAHHAAHTRTPTSARSSFIARAAPPLPPLTPPATVISIGCVIKPRRMPHSAHRMNVAPLSA